MDSVIAIGGNNGKVDLNSVERYIVKDNYWIELQPMQIKRNGASCCIFDRDRKIFVFGGINS